MISNFAKLEQPPRAATNDTNHTHYTHDTLKTTTKMTLALNQLPVLCAETIFRLLTPREVLNVAQTGKAMRAQVRKCVAILNLDEYESWAFVDAMQCHPWISWRHARTFSTMQCSNAVRKSICDASFFAHMHAVNLSFTSVVDVSALAKLHKVNLSGTRVRDVSALGNVHTLVLTATRVSDVSALQNVHTLCLAFTDVTDVSMLTQAHKIDLRGTIVEYMLYTD